MRLLIVVLVACAPSQAEMDRSNSAALVAANTRASEHIDRFASTSMPVFDPDDLDAQRVTDRGTAPTVKRVIHAGLLAPEHLGVVDNGTVVLLGPLCTSADQCGRDRLSTISSHRRERSSI